MTPLFLCPFLLSTPELTSPTLDLLGATAPFDALPGTIRGDYSLCVGRNVCHGSDTEPGSAEKEIALWFKDEELINWTSAQDAWINE